MRRIALSFLLIASGLLMAPKPTPKPTPTPPSYSHWLSQWEAWALQNAATPDKWADWVNTHPPVPDQP
jgi:hypothetical protein